MNARSLITVVALMVASLFAAPAYCCTCVEVSYNVSRTFDVVVESRLDLTGAAVRITPLFDSALKQHEGRIGADHKVSFRQIPAGKYFLSFVPESANGVCGGATLNVEANGQKSVPLSFVDDGVLKARSLVGKFEFEGVRAQTIAASVLNIRTGAIAAKEKIHEDGAFAIDVAPGLYAVQLRPENRNEAGTGEGDVFVSIDGDAAHDRLNIRLGDSTCGLMYAANCRPARPQEAVNNMRGLVVDTVGAVIPAADVVVRAGNEEVGKTRTDNTGKFLFPEMSPGLYQLRLRSPGFHTTDIEIQVSRDGSNKALIITMPINGSCGENVTFADHNGEPTN